MNILKRYEVLEIVSQVINRERRWYVDAISEQDAVRQVVDMEAPDDYAGERDVLVSSDESIWKVDGKLIDFAPAEATPQEDEHFDMGGGD